MSTSSKFRILDQGKAFYESPEAVQSEDGSFSLSTVLKEERVFEPNAYNGAWQVCCAVQGLEPVVVTFTYTDRVETLRVLQGRPLFFRTEPENFISQVKLESITVAPEDRQARLELSIFKAQSIAPLPTDAFLALNASTGVTLDPDGNVASWEDSRPDSVLSGKWVPSADPPFSASGRDEFNQQPNISFNSSTEYITTPVDRSLDYDGPLSDFDFLTGGETDFTVCAVLTHFDTGLAGGLFGIGGATAPGFDCYFDGGNFLRQKVHDGVGGIVFEYGNDRIELRPLGPDEEREGQCWALVYKFRATDTRLDIRSQGETWTGFEQPGTLPAALASAAMKIGGRVDGSAPFRGAIADFRIYKRVITDEEEDSYFSNSEAIYAADNSFYPYFDASETLWLFRANRDCVFNENGAVINLKDSREDSTFDQFNVVNGEVVWNVEPTSGQPALSVRRSLNDFDYIDYAGAAADWNIVSATAEFRLCFCVRFDSLAVSESEVKYLYGQTISGATAGYPANDGDPHTAVCPRRGSDGLLIETYCQQSDGTNTPSSSGVFTGVFNYAADVLVFSIGFPAALDLGLVNITGSGDTANSGGLAVNPPSGDVRGMRLFSAWGGDLKFDGEILEARLLDSDSGTHEKFVEYCETRYNVVAPE